MAPPCCDKSDIFFYYTFHYRPNVWGAASQALMFLLMTFVIARMNYIYARRTGNAAKYMHIVTVVGIMEAVGYGLRIYAAEAEAITPYIMTTLLLLISPIALAVVNYVVVGKLLRASGKQVGFLKPTHITRLFLASDVICFMIQGGAGGLLASKDPLMQDLGANVVLSGLGIQTFFFTAFVAISIYMACSRKFGLMLIPALRPVFAGLFLSIGCLYIRNIYRFVEFASGIESPVVTHELIFNMFETLPLLLSLGVYATYHFGKLLPADADLPALVLKGESPGTTQIQLV